MLTWVQSNKVMINLEVCEYFSPMLNKPEMPVDPNNFHLDLILIIKDKISGNSAEFHLNFYSENYKEYDLENSKFAGLYLKEFSWENLDSALRVMFG